MAITTTNSGWQPSLSPLAASMLQALRTLAKGYQQRPCGGFTKDDISWRRGVFFEDNNALDEALEELLQAKLIHYVGIDDESEKGSCYLPCADVAPIRVGRVYRYNDGVPMDSALGSLRSLSMALTAIAEIRPALAMNNSGMGHWLKGSTKRAIKADLRERVEYAVGCTLRAMILLRMGVFIR